MLINPIRVRLNRVWPKLLFAGGWAAFWLAVAAGDKAPVPTLFMGPAVMLVATILLVRRTAQRRAVNKS